jgi:hypothetical protein
MGICLSDLNMVAQLSGWPTPNAMDTIGESSEKALARRKTKGGCCNLKDVVGWPTPNVPTRGAESRESKDNRNSGGLDLQTTASLAGWATPRLEDGESAGMRHSRGVADTLSAQVGQDLAGWGSPQANDWKGASTTREIESRSQLKHQLPLGPIASSSPAGTTKCGVLNPAFPLWLMGYPETWQHSCPGWKSWDTIQRLLAESSEKPAGTE